jgi:hypothetical protein
VGEPASLACAVLCFNMRLMLCLLAVARVAAREHLNYMHAVYACTEIRNEYLPEHYIKSQIIFIDHNHTIKSQIIFIDHNHTIIWPNMHNTDVCTDKNLENPCPRQSVCQHSTAKADFTCACDPSQGYRDEPLDGGFCVKMHYLRDLAGINSDYSVCTHANESVCIHCAIWLASTRTIR